MKFGYTLTPSSRIDLDLFNRDKFNALVKLEPDILKCMACGSCTASCSVGNFADSSLRSAILALQNGQEKRALELLSHCVLCGKCIMVCPRGINTRNLILAINRIYSTVK